MSSATLSPPALNSSRLGRRHFLQKAAVAGGLASIGGMGAAAGVAIETIRGLDQPRTGRGRAVPRPGPRSFATLAALSSPDPTSIPEVLDRLADVRDHAAATSTRGNDDGVACFSRLYHVITSTVDHTVRSGGFTDNPFLVTLDIAFARRYLWAIRAYARDMNSTPACWRILFDRRENPAVPPENFAAAGVNAHVNYDLPFALLDTWRSVTPDDPVQRRDYHYVNDVFAQEMNGLRTHFRGAPGSSAPEVAWNVVSNRVCDTAVTLARDLAWNEAVALRGTAGQPDAFPRAQHRLDTLAVTLGHAILSIPALPF